MPPRSPLDVGSLYRERRKELGLSQAEVCERAGLTRPTLRALETGARVSESTRSSASSALGWPVNAYEQLASGIAVDGLAEGEGVTIPLRQGFDLVEMACRLMGMSESGVDLTLRVARSQMEFPER